jgi:predicted regulator of Ras-like GTPase activity (Roadblock/LC7/MglB family)
MTGMELVQEASKLSAQTHFILMTAHQETSQIRASIEELNLSGFVSKPFTMPDLLKVVQQVTSNMELDTDKEAVDPTLPKADIKRQLQSLRRQCGAHIVLLVNSEGAVVHAVGNTDRARISRLAAFVSANFLAITELSSLFGDTDSVFKSSYYEGNKYNIYAYNINGDYFLAVVFGVGGKPGTVWFYTKQIAAELADVMPTSETTALSQDASVALAEDFETLVGDENKRENNE